MLVSLNILSNLSIPDKRKVKKKRKKKGELYSDCTGHFSNQFDIFKVAKVVYGNLSHNHCNWSDTWPSILLPELY